MNEFQLFIKVGQNIREIRESKNISQQELASRCNFEKSNLSRIEAGRTNITLKTLLIISESLAVSVKELLDVD
jgi:transcriptional regulator with XRE-family HTH domain